MSEACDWAHVTTAEHRFGGSDYDHARRLLRLSDVSDVRRLARPTTGWEEVVDVAVETELEGMELIGSIAAVRVSSAYAPPTSLDSRSRTCELLR